MLPLTQRPLTSADADSAFYVGREGELDRAMRSIALGFNVVVFGERGSGRTSFLRQLQRRLRDRGPHLRFVSGQGWPDTRGLLEAIRADFGDDVRGPRYRLEVPGATLGIFKRVVEDPGPTMTEDDVRYLASAIEEAPSVLEVDRPASGWTVLLDDVAGLAGHRVFGRFRDEMWQLPVQWVVATTAGDVTNLLKPPADAFFDTRIDLRPLDRQEAVELLRARLDAAPGATSGIRDALQELVDGVRVKQPRSLIGALRAAALSDAPAHQVASRRARLEQRAAALGRGEAMLFSELQALGPVHAGDPELLDRLGVTRPRVVQLLGRLEQAGLVSSQRDGRRKVYAVNEADDE